MSFALKLNMDIPKEDIRTLLDGSPICNKIIDLEGKLQYMSSAGVKALKEALIAHPELGNGWTGRGQGCTALVTVEYQCAKPKAGVDGTITISINRGNILRSLKSCKTGVRRITEIVKDALAKQGLDTFFDLGKTMKDDDFFTFTSTFNMDEYSSADVAA